MPGLVQGKLWCNTMGLSAARAPGAGKDVPLVRIGGRALAQVERYLGAPPAPKPLEASGGSEQKSFCLAWGFICIHNTRPRCH